MSIIAPPPKVGGQGPTPQTGGTAGGSGIQYPSTHQGWGSIRFAVNQSLPGALRQGTRSFAATYAVLGATRKGR